MATLAQIVAANPDDIFEFTENTAADILAGIVYGPCSVCGESENVLFMADHADLCYTCWLVVITD